MHPFPPQKLPLGYAVRNMPARSFYRAIHGFGPAPEQVDPASLKRLKEILFNQKVVDLRAEEIGQPNRVILRELVMDSGTRIHFETSAKGACVYYIEEPGPSCLEVVDRELAESHPGSVDSSGEEAGRTSQNDLGEFESSPPRNVGEAGASELPDTGGVPPMPETSGVLPGPVP
jgi:hypothetical protein